MGGEVSSLYRLMARAYGTFSKLLVAFLGSSLLLSWALSKMCTRMCCPRRGDSSSPVPHLLPSWKSTSPHKGGVLKGMFISENLPQPKFKPPNRYRNMERRSRLPENLLRLERLFLFQSSSGSAQDSVSSWNSAVTHPEEPFWISLNFILWLHFYDEVQLRA